MNTATLMRPDSLYRIVILNGPDKGTSYKVLAGRVSLGRGHDNDVVINDPKCSRQHAILEIRNGEVEIIDVSHKNMIMVDSQKFSQTKLTTGGTFTIGATNIRVELDPESREPDDQTAAVPATRPLVAPVASSPAPTRPAFSRPLDSTRIYNKPAPAPRRPKPKRSPTFYVILALIGALVIWIITSHSSRKSHEIPIATNAQVESTIKAFQKKDQELLRRTQLTPQEKQAQIYYLEGFRDFRKGQDGPAITEFRAALSMNPQFELASRYLRMAQMQQDRMIEEDMIAGRQYHDRGMYQLCVASFDIVMTTLNDPNNLTYREAKAIREECALRLKGNF